MSSPTQRTLKYCQNQGWQAQVTESYNSFTRRRKDLFGFIDVLALDVANQKTIGIQTTTASHINARVDKIKSECSEAAKNWLAAGNEIVVQGWKKKKLKRGGKAVRWVSVERAVTASDFLPA